MDFKRKEIIIEFKDSGGVVIGVLTAATPRLLEEGRLDELQNMAAQINQAELEAKGEAGTLTEEEDKRQYFRLSLYPKLAACSSGDVPDEQTAFDMPVDQFWVWYNAVKQVAPQWFEIFDKIQEAFNISMAAGEKEKKESAVSQLDSPID